LLSCTQKSVKAGTSTIGPMVPVSALLSKRTERSAGIAAMRGVLPTTWAWCEIVLCQVLHLDWRSLLFRFWRCGLHCDHVRKVERRQSALQRCVFKPDKYCRSILRQSHKTVSLEGHQTCIYKFNSTPAHTIPLKIVLTSPVTGICFMVRYRRFLSLLGSTAGPVSDMFDTESSVSNDSDSSDCAAPEMSGKSFIDLPIG
jgi:hypothetical protein